MPRPFRGTINLDIRDSKPDWDAFLDTKAPADAPNVLVILYDDTGCAAWSTYGGRIEMPTLDRLAKNGPTYTQWHTTLVCSPTRSCFLTGRNRQQNGFGTIAERRREFRGTSHPATERHDGDRCKQLDPESEGSGLFRPIRAVDPGSCRSKSGRGADPSTRSARSG